MWNQHPRICQNAKNCAKQRKNQIWDQDCLIWVFRAINLKKYCHVWYQHPRICKNAKFRAKLKIVKGPKMPDLSVFRLQF